MASNDEIWKPVLGFEGSYEVSNIGGVRSLPRKVNGRWGNLRNTPGKALKLDTTKNGYRRTQLCAEGKAQAVYVHRLVAEAFLLNDLNKPCVNHIDLDKSNNTVENLEWCTYSENTKHAFDNGRIVGTFTKKEKCHQGHEIKLINTRRKCIECTQRRGREYQARRRARLKEARLATEIERLK